MTNTILADHQAATRQVELRLLEEALSENRSAAETIQELVLAQLIDAAITEVRRITASLQVLLQQKMDCQSSSVVDLSTNRAV